MELGLRRLLAVSKEAQEFVRASGKKVFIFCNHPHCFTLGRGNERGDTTLVDFDAEQIDLDLPLYKIHRGGELLFIIQVNGFFTPSKKSHHRKT
jgi:lipoate-protein ligase B